MKIIIVPGNGCSDDIRSINFYGWLEDQLLEKKYVVNLPEYGMPDPILARAKIWLPFIHNKLCSGNSTDAVLIGHSSGAVAGLKFAETNKVAGLVLVAAYDNDLGDENEAASGYFDVPFEWNAIVRNCGFIVQFAGTEDELVPIQVQRRVAKSLGPKCQYHELHNNHFFCPPFNEIVAAVENNLQNKK